MAVDLNLLNSNSISNISTNFQRVEEALADAVSRSGTLPNHMTADIDLNSNDLLNVGIIDAEDINIDGINLSIRLQEVVDAKDEAEDARDIAVASALSASTSANSAANSASKAEDARDVTLAAKDAAVTASEAVGVDHWADTYADAEAGLEGYAEGDVIGVFADETKDGVTVWYRVEDGALVEKLDTADQTLRSVRQAAEGEGLFTGDMVLGTDDEPQAKRVPVASGTEARDGTTHRILTVAKSRIAADAWAEDRSIAPLVGLSSERPSVPDLRSAMFFDQDLGKPIFWNGTDTWVDVNGDEVPWWNFGSVFDLDFVNDRYAYNDEEVALSTFFSEDLVSRLSSDGLDFTGSDPLGMLSGPAAALFAAGSFTVMTEHTQPTDPVENRTILRLDNGSAAERLVHQYNVNAYRAVARSGDAVVGTVGQVPGLFSTDPKQIITTISPGLIEFQLDEEPVMRDEIASIPAMSRVELAGKSSGSNNGFVGKIRRLVGWASKRELLVEAFTPGYYNYLNNLISDVRYINNNAGLTRSVQYDRQRDTRHLRFEVHEGDQYPPADVGQNRDRSEFQAAEGPGQYVAHGTDLWQSYSFRVADFANPSDWFVLGQWHGELAGRSPWFAIQLQPDGSLRLLKRAVPASGGDPVFLGLYDDTDFERDRWYSIVCHLKTGEADGVAEVWMDGIKVVDFTGAIGYLDEGHGGYWKFGIYRSRDTSIAVVDFANMRVGTEDLSDKITNPDPVS